MFPQYGPRVNQRGSALITLLMAITIGLAAIALSMSIYAYSLQSWTGTGTVVNRVHSPASDGDFMLLPVMQGVFMVADTSSPESYSLTVRDDSGDEHPFRVTKEQYDSAPQGSRYSKTK